MNCFALRRINMEDWQVNLIIGLASVFLGFIGGFVTKTIQIKLKIKQKAKGENIKQSIGNINNGK